MNKIFIVLLALILLAPCSVMAEEEFGVPPGFEAGTNDPAFMSGDTNGVPGEGDANNAAMNGDNFFPAVPGGGVGAEDLVVPITDLRNGLKTLEIITSVALIMSALSAILSLAILLRSRRKV